MHIQMISDTRGFPTTPVRPAKTQRPALTFRNRTKPATPAPATPTAPSLAQASRLSAQASLRNLAEPTPVKFSTTRPGDVDGNGRVDKKDLTAMINYLFGDGEAPSHLANADLNGDGRYSLADIVKLLQNLTQRNDDD